MGRAAAYAPVPFVGAVAHFAGTTPDTTLTLVTISLPSRALTFTRENERYRGSYSVQLRLLRGATEVARVDALEIVRIGAFRETARTDESVIFQRWLRTTPGDYTLRLVLRDVGSGRASADSVRTTVPRLMDGDVSTPLPVYEARPRGRLDSLPALVARPRSTAVFGRDSAVTVYIEAYGPPTSAQAPIRVTARNEAGVIVWNNLAALPRRGALFSGTITVPVANVGVGIGVVTVARADGTDTAVTPVFVSFGDDLPVAAFDEMLSYLRFFASATRLRTLRESPPERRAQLWADFLQETDPSPQTPENEALQAYFARIQLANTRFRDETRAGWLSDRGMVFVGLGEPDQILEQSVSAPGSQAIQGFTRVQVWEYREWRAQLVFTDQRQAGIFRLTLNSEREFRSLLQRQLR
jgi:GWxTD domain-containing protein